MPTPPLKPGHPRWPEVEQAWRFKQKGMIAKDIAAAMGQPQGTVERWLAVHPLRAEDPAITEAKAAVGTHLTPSGVWIKTDGYSVYLRPESGPELDLRAVIQEEVAGLAGEFQDKLPRRFETREGNLFVLDPADVHIGKLSVQSETGVRYDIDIATHRLVEGSRMLLERAMRDGVTRVLFVIGNDIAHFDNPRRQTTSGTPQDASGSLHDVYRAAQRAYIKIVRMALEMGLHIDIVFNPSNHDWIIGWTIAQAVGAVFVDHPNVGVSDYYLSERHRKYYRFGRNLIGTSHGDGAKESDLPQLMMVEARPHIAECLFLYWYVHHYHHKMRKAAGVRSMPREKDHIAMTAIMSGPGAMEGDNCHIEYVRSPSEPDGWHHRNGYINRQAVEGFIHHPYDGQITRFTEWF